MNEADKAMMAEMLNSLQLPLDKKDKEPTMGGALADDDVVDLGSDFDFDGFQVVRREFFAHRFEPSATFSNCKFYVNSACFNKFPTSDYAHVLVNRQQKILALRPCPEYSRDSFQWCSMYRNKRKPKAITCKLFFAKIAALMDWNPDYRYKLLGRLAHCNDEYIIMFDLTAAEIYRRLDTVDGKPKMSKTPVFPFEWQDQFGLPYNEHKQSLQVNIVDGYAVYSIKDENGESGEAVSSGGEVNE